MFSGYIQEGPHKNVVQLDDGKYLFFDYGKYGSGLAVVVANLEDALFKEDAALTKQLNLNYTGTCHYAYGRYFKSRKGRDMFDTTGAKPHVLVSIDWGGVFNKSRGLKHVPEQALYYRRASSNGGGLGVDYIVLPADYEGKHSINDF